ncbi:MAG: sigma-54-dependent Fis family transcriptional regulator [Deltaproteobacteria bacterium]|nr:sigma-54-dependent Fis family transcriptional regulator [Deltaproteobacteria bacterium]
MREFLSICLRRAGHDVVVAESAEDASRQLGGQLPFDLVITDLKLPGGSGLDLLDEVKARSPDTPVIVVTAYATPETAISAMKRGAYDYLNKPFKVDEIGLVIARALEKRQLVRDNALLRERISERHGLDRMIGKSPPMQQVFELCRKVAPTRANVLVLGESGTGKELVARAVHHLSPRARAALVAVHCAAIPETLLESELFGHVKGAFTGALSDKPGLFETATGGTLFLDEIGELPPALQVKLLRALQERVVKPVGSVHEREVDVRVIAASNRDLEDEVAHGRFRQDLYYRLNVVPIRLPPLRDRRADIPLLADHFIRHFAAELGRPAPVIEPAAMAALCANDWPGNVRELENVIERAVTLESRDRIDLESLAGLRSGGQGAAALLEFPRAGFDLDQALGAVERGLIEKALAHAGGVRKEAARLLGVSLRSLRYRLVKLGIEPAGAGEDGAESDD